MWKQENRQRYNRDKLRYPSDLTDAEWSLVEALMPPAKWGGCRREVDVREILDGIMYVLSTSCQWRYVPGDLQPRSRSMAICNAGTMTGHWGRSITRYTRNAANRLAERPVPRPALSTV
jgi:hypothetical protein